MKGRNAELILIQMLREKKYLIVKLEHLRAMKAICCEAKLANKTEHGFIYLYDEDILYIKVDDIGWKTSREWDTRRHQVTLMINNDPLAWTRNELINIVKIIAGTTWVPYDIERYEHVYIVKCRNNADPLQYVSLNVDYNKNICSIDGLKSIISHNMMNEIINPTSDQSVYDAIINEINKSVEICTEQKKYDWKAVLDAVKEIEPNYHDHDDRIPGLTWLNKALMNKIYGKENSNAGN